MFLCPRHRGEEDAGGKPAPIGLAQTLSWQRVQRRGVTQVAQREARERVQEFQLKALLKITGESKKIQSESMNTACTRLCLI